MPRPNHGPRLSDQPNDAGYWEIRWTEDGRSKRRSSGCKNYADAIQVLANFVKLKVRADAEDSKDLDDLPMTVAEALGDPEAAAGDDYWHEHVVPNVIGKDTAKFATVKLHQHYGHIAIRDLKPADTTQYIDKRIEGEIGHPSVNSTIARELTVLSAAIHHAAAHRKAKIMLRADDNLPVISKPPAAGPRDRWLRFEEAEACLRVARARDDKRLSRIYLFLTLALHTAARSEAIRQLTWFQVDLDRRLINYNPPGRAQTNKKRPTVAISDTLLPILTQARKEARTEFVVIQPGSIRTAFASVIEDAGLAVEEPILTPKGKEPTDVEREAHEILWQAWWQSRVTPHTFRHTWATWAYQRGEAPADVAAVLGDSIRTVENNYAHHHPDFQKKAVNATPKIGAL